MMYCTPSTIVLTFVQFRHLYMPYNKVDVGPKPPAETQKNLTATLVNGIVVGSQIFYLKFIIYYLVPSIEGFNDSGRC
jgi:hypothetical protein